MKKFFKNLFKSKIKLGILIVVVLALGFFIYGHMKTSAAPTRYVLAQAAKQTIVVSITGTGQVSQDHTVSLSPSSAGKITSVNVKQGDKVKQGQTIAVVDETNNTIALNQAEAGLRSAQANYDTVLAGTTSQDLQLAQLTVDSDQQALNTATKNLDTVKQQQAQIVANAQTAMLNSSLQAIPAQTNTSNVTLTISGTYTGTDQGSYVVTVQNSGAGQPFSYTGLSQGAGNVSKTVPQALGTKGLFILFSGNPNDGDSWTISIPNLMASSYNSNQNSYQTALTNQASAITAAQNQITSAQNKLDQDKINLQVKQLPPTDQQVESAKASLQSAQAQVQNAQIAYSNNIIKAPFDGTVAQLTGQVGDQAAASTVVAIVVNNQSQAVIPLNEVDVSTVKLGDKATMTFDALSSLTLTGTVVQIDTIGTVSQGVVNYNVKVAFDTEDPSVKPGMSVNVAIITNTAADALSVPSSAVKTLNGQSFVQELDPAHIHTIAGQTGVTSDTSPKQVMVQTGISDGTNTQILNGLNEGDSVISQTISAAKTTTSATSSSAIPGLGGGGGGTFFRAGGGGAGAGRPGG